MANAKHLRPMAAYFVQMRDLERRLLVSALEVFESLDGAPELAAGILGIPLSYFRVRARMLGGVFPGDPKHEPPTMTVTEAWSKESRKRKPKPEDGFDA